MPSGARSTRQRDIRVRRFSVGLAPTGAGVHQLCAVCCVPRRTEPFHLTHGVTVDLCATHRDVIFLRRRGGSALTDRLERIWSAHRVLTASRRRALAAHRRRVRGEPAERPRPGSYSWPRLRNEAEERFARGERAGPVIADVRRRYAGYDAQAPSTRTIRRWFAEGRWLADQVASPSRQRRTTRRNRPVRRKPLAPNFEGPFGPLDPLYPFGSLIWDFSWMYRREDDFGGRSP